MEYTPIGQGSGVIPQLYLHTLVHIDKNYCHIEDISFKGMLTITKELAWLGKLESFELE